MSKTVIDALCACAAEIKHLNYAERSAVISCLGDISTVTLRREKKADEEQEPGDEIPASLIPYYPTA